MSTENHERISKAISYLLRHAHASFNLGMDEQGWVLLTDLILALRRVDVNINETDIIKLIENSEKKRHQILGGKIRSLYGHSNVKICKIPSVPPDILFHGTLQKNLERIMDKGILPMGRQYVHLSANEAIAWQVARRKKGIAVVIKVSAKEAFMNSIQFYEEVGGIWLTDFIPSRFIIT